MRRENAAVQEDLPEHAQNLVEDHDKFRCLYDLKRNGDGGYGGDGPREAA